MERNEEERQRETKTEKKSYLKTQTKTVVSVLSVLDLPPVGQLGRTLQPTLVAPVI